MLIQYNVIKSESNVNGKIYIGSPLLKEVEARGISFRTSFDIFSSLQTFLFDNARIETYYITRV